MAGAGPSSASVARSVVGVTGTNRLPNSGVLRIQQELQTLIRDPVPFIYVAADEADITKITALIIGPLETPYAVCAVFSLALLCFVPPLRYKPHLRPF